MYQPKKYIDIPLALGLCGLLAVEISKQHAEFVAVSPTIDIVGAAFTNTAAGMLVSVPQSLESLTSVEIKIPQHRLLVQTTGLLLSIKR
jgi:hypothetical protein